MGDWNRYLRGEEPGTERESAPSQAPLRSWGFAHDEAAWQERHAEEMRRIDERIAARRSAEEAERAAYNAARAADEAAKAAITAAEKAADAEIVARCVTIDAYPRGGKRYTLQNFQFAGCRLHRTESLDRRATRLLVLPLEDGWSISWEDCCDGELFAVTTANAGGQSVKYTEQAPQNERVRESVPALSHNPFAARFGKR